MKHKHICPPEIAWFLDNPIRKLIHDPKKIIRPFVKPGMKVLDFGCASGTFTREIAKLSGDNGKVIAADIQEEMLKKLRKNIKGRDIEKRIKIVKTDNSSINIKEKIDLAFALFVIHEVKNEEKTLLQIYNILKKKGKFIILEPKTEISEQEFKNIIKMAEKIGFKQIKKLKVPLSYGVLLER